MKGTAEVIGKIARYVLAIVACVSLAQFLLLIAVETEHAQRLAGGAFVRTLLFGAVAGWWFYRARKAPEPKQPVLPLPSEPSVSAPIAATAEPQGETPKEEGGVPVHTGRDMSLAFLVIAGFLVFVLILGLSIRRSDSPSPTGSSLDMSTSQPVGNASAPPQLPNSAELPKCPSAIPAGVKAKLLSPEQMKAFVGTEAEVSSFTDYSNGLWDEWVAHLNFTNGSEQCISSAEVEITLQQADSIFIETHTVVFKPILAFGKNTKEQVTLRRRTKDSEEPLGIQEWRITKAWGFTLELQDGAKMQNIVAPPPPTKNSAPIRVNPEVQSAKLIVRIEPTYPPLARQTRIQGTVRLEAMIAKNGTVKNLAVVTGHPLLIQAALDTVKQWRYQPTMSNGIPVEVVTTVDVNFKLIQ